MSIPFARQRSRFDPSRVTRTRSGGDAARWSEFICRSLLLASTAFISLFRIYPIVDSTHHLLIIEANIMSPSSYKDHSSTDEVASLIGAVKALLPKDGSSSFDREQLLFTAHKLSIALETPGETAQRIMYLVRDVLSSLFEDRRLTYQCHSLCKR